MNEKNIKHVVLNAKNHENEADIIANAGKEKSVIITTSISGRGVDIQLGGKKVLPLHSFKLMWKRILMIMMRRHKNKHGYEKLL